MLEAVRQGRAAVARHLQAPEQVNEITVGVPTGITIIATAWTVTVAASISSSHAARQLDTNITSVEHAAILLQGRLQHVARLVLDETGSAEPA